MASPSHSTSTLLVRLREHGGDDGAWSQFVDRYGPQFYGWCRRHGLQDADASDVMQEVLLRVAKGVKTFDRERANARSWLFTILRNSFRDWLHHRDPAPGVDVARALLESKEALDDLERRLAEEFDLERKEVAEHNVRSRLRGAATWLAYELTCRQGLSYTEAAERLKIRRPHVIRSRNRVIKMVAEEVRSLAAAEESRQGP